MNARYRRQRGAVTLVGALFIIITLALMIQVLQRTSASDMLDSAVQSDSVEAFFIAESGLEHAAALYGAGSCDASLAGTPINVGRGNFTIEDIGAGFNNDFSSAGLPATACRIRVTAVIPTLGVQRIVEGIFNKDGNLLGSANANFNDPDPPCDSPCVPTGWNDLGSWDDGGGPTGDTDDRAAYVIKLNNGAGFEESAGSYNLTPFTVNGGDVLTLVYDFKVSGSGGGASPKAFFNFSLGDGTTTWSATEQQSNWTSGYVIGMSVTITIGGTGPVTITDFDFSMRTKSGQAGEIWLDNLDLRGPGGGGTGVSLLQWREVVSN